MKCTDPHEVWLAWKKENLLGNLTQNVLCVSKRMRFQALYRRKRIVSTHIHFLWEWRCHLVWMPAVMVSFTGHECQRTLLSLSLDFSLSFPLVLQLTSSPVFSIFSFLFPPITLWAFCPLFLVFSTPPPPFWVGEGHGLCLSYLNFHFPKECFRHTRLCTYTHADAQTVKQQAELLSWTDHFNLSFQIL